LVAGGFQIDQDRYFAAQLVEGVEVDGDAATGGDGSEMHQAVGRTADGHQYANSIFESIKGQYIRRPNAIAMEPNNILTGLKGQS